MGKRFQLQKHTTSLFLVTSETATSVIATANDRQPIMVLHKQRRRPDHDCNRRRAQDANLRLHHSSSDAIIFDDTVPASASDTDVTFAGAVLFARKPPTPTKREGTLGDRIDLRMPGQVEELYTLSEKEANISHFQFDETSLEFSKQIDDELPI